MEGRDKNADLVLKRWEKAGRTLIEERRNFQLNSAFYEGYQWVAWDNKSNSVVNFSQLQGGDDTRVRLKINKIQERVNQLMGRFCQRVLAFEGQPNAADDATINGARLSEAVLEASHLEQDWESVREDEVFAAIMGGTSAVAAEWDPQAEAVGIGEESASGQVTNTGDVKLTAYAITEFAVETGSRSWHDARWWIGARGRPPAQVKAQYGLDWMPKPDASGAYSPLQREIAIGRGQANTKDLCIVYTLYEKPNAAAPKGRHLVVINEKVVVDEPWPFPFKHLNLWVFRQVKVPMRWTGITICSEARAPQIAYNAVRSAIIEHAKMSGNARMIVPQGAFDDDAELTDEAGEIVHYWPGENGAKPEWMAPPQLPRWLTSEPDRIESELDGILHTHAVSRGESTGSRDSGLALSILAEKNDTPLGPMAHDQAQGWSTLGTMVLKIYEAKVPGPRKVVQVGESGVPHTFEWNGKRLQGQTRVIVPLDATMPTSRAATQAMLANMAAQFPQLAQALSVPMLTKVMDLPGSKVLSQIADPDVAWSHRENELIAAGEPRIPMPWEDHAAHMAEHNAFRKSKAYDAADEHVKQIFQAHLDAHQRLIEEEAQSQAKLNAINPGFAGLPQANEPIGSAVPPSYAEQQALAGRPGGAPKP